MPPDHQMVIAELQKKLQVYEEAMTSQSTEPEEEDVIDLREYWNVLMRRKWTVILTVLLLLISVFIATAMMTALVLLLTLSNVMLQPPPLSFLPLPRTATAALGNAAQAGTSGTPVRRAHSPILCTVQ